MSSSSKYRVVTSDVIYGSGTNKMTFSIYYADDPTKSEIVSPDLLSNSRVRGVIYNSSNGSTKPTTNYINGLSCAARNMWYSFGKDSNRDDFWTSEGDLDRIATLNNNRLTIEAYDAYNLYEAVFWSEFKWYIDFVIWL